MRIFIHRPDQTYGPYTLAEIRESLATGNVVLSDNASYDGHNGRVPLSAVPGVTGTASDPSSQKTGAVRFSQGTPPGVAVARKRAPLGCCSWMMVGAGLLFLIATIGGLIEGDKDKNGVGATSKSGPSQHASPRQFGYGLGTELLRHARSNSGVTGIVFFAQSCRRENPTVRTYSDKEYAEFQNGMIAAYQDWVIRNGISE